MIDSKELEKRWNNRNKYIVVCENYLNEQQVEYTKKILADIPYFILRDCPSYLYISKILTYYERGVTVEKATKLTLLSLNYYLEEL